MIKETIFKLEGHNGDYFCLQGQPVSQDENGAGGKDIAAKLSLSMGYYQVENWRNELTLVYQTLKGQASYHSYYKNIAFTIEAEMGGRLRFSGIYQEYCDDFASLAFEMNTDQSYLPQVLADIDAF
ncbi:hypothetical protein, partial [Streptococcus suis]|uniref:WapI family immunity protein n=2 Tax=Streptococcus TaxID=1301 RepID=UPI001290661F